MIGDLPFSGGRIMKSSRWLIILRHAQAPAKALGASCLALWTVAIAVAATPAIADEVPNRIRIEYAPPKSENYQSLVDRLKANRALDKMQEIFGSFRLPTDINLKTMECGMANAWYQRPTVTICYEYLDDIEKGVRKETHDGITHNDAVLGHFIYVVAHEMGHALFDTLNVPLFGTA
jgi:Putative metallopeptidase